MNSCFTYSQLRILIFRQFGESKMATIWDAPLRGKVPLGKSVFDQFKDHWVQGAVPRALKDPSNF